jgi:hypothetical protein
MNLSGSNGSTDFVTKSDKGITIEHANIHAGMFYSASDIFVSMSSSATYSISILTSNDCYVHYRNERVSTSADKLKIILYEGSAVTGGTTVSAINHNRINSNTSDTIVKKGITITSAGTTISTSYIGGGTNQGNNRSGGDTTGNNEFVLKRNTQYAIKLENGSSSTNIINIEPIWYEEEYGES